MDSIDVKAERPSTPVLTSTKEESTTPAPSTPTPRPSGPQLISHLPRAEEEARKTFIELDDNVYQYKTLGLSKQAEEGFTCDCTYEIGDDERDACGEGSNCINRLTQVECLEDDCRCRTYCQNQRFQRKQYAPFEIVKTELKGFGLRAAADLPKDAFVYEYIGEVVSHPSFAKRMRDYADEGIRHFYFMMLQKDEFIDATKRGGVGRFANHSCNPNCYVAKWTVGRKVRMGIFTKRSIKKHEELTFNYNVDRYGHDAQPCYCGEVNCVGFIGGKTQTDIAAMDDVVLDALGVTEEVALRGKRKKGPRKLEEIEAVVKPVDEKSAAKVLAALRQTTNRSLLTRLLARIKVTEDQNVLREIMRLRGFSTMNAILRDQQTDEDMCCLILTSLSTWPLLMRNKVEDSKIEEPIKELQKSGKPRLEELATKLLEQWAELEIAYRIPKRVPPPPDSNGHAPKNSIDPAIPEDQRPSKRVRFGEQAIDAPVLSIKPLGRKEHVVASSNTQFYTPPPIVPTTPVHKKPTKEELNAIIAAAMEATKVQQDRDLLRENGNPDGSSQPITPPSKPKTSSRDARVLKMVGAVVVKSMSKYQSQMEHETFKKHARNITHLVAEKEKRSDSYSSMKLDVLPDAKKAKIKKFVKEYIHKVLRRLKEIKARAATREKQRAASGGSKAGGSQDGHADDDHGEPTAMEMAELLMQDDDDPPEDESLKPASKGAVESEQLKATPMTDPPETAMETEVS